MIVTDKLKESLKNFMGPRAAAGEGSLKTWGSAQKPPITGSQAEDVADALVDEGVLEKEERASGFVWRKVLSAAPAAPVAAENDEEQDEEDDEEEEEAPPSAPAAAPVAQPAPERRNASVTPAPAPAAAPVEAPAPSTTLPYSPELISTIVALPEAQWQAVTLARRTLSEARALIARGTALEAEAIKALDRALSGSPEAAAPAPVAVAVEEPPPPPAGWARTRTVETGENAGTARDKIMRLFMASPGKQMRASEVAEALGWSLRACSGPLSTLVRDEKLERPYTGVYCLAARLARKAA